MIYPELSDLIIGSCFEVHNILGPGLLEMPYHNALCNELRRRGISCESEVPFNVIYKDDIIGEYYADLVVDGKIILEIKSVAALTTIMAGQIINYLRISNLRVGYLINFQQPSVQYKRYIV